jgi:hypothetical protein
MFNSEDDRGEAGGVVVRRPIRAGYEACLRSEALNFVADLARNFTNRVGAGEWPTYPAETALFLQVAAARSDFPSPCPPLFQREITCPSPR